MMRLPRYRYGARFYDRLSAEGLVYRRGRACAIRLLDLRPGDRVLVVGCGTGLDLPLLTSAVGEAGTVVGVDKSASMLRQAREKVRRAGWRNIELIEGDAAELAGVRGQFDAALFTYSLAIVTDWHRAWGSALGKVRRGGRVAVVDTDLPTGMASPLRPLARMALWTGGVDRGRKVWTAVLEELTDVHYHRLAHGHIHVGVGTTAAATSSKGT